MHYELVLVTDKFDSRGLCPWFNSLDTAKIVGAHSGLDYGVIEVNGLISRVVFDTRYEVSV
jgi:hypothetical protein